MVNVRHALALVVDRGLIDAATHDVLVREMKRLDYPQRSWLVVRSIAEREQLPDLQIEALLGFVQSARPNVKREDAIELLAALSAPELLDLPPFEASFQFESTVFWDQLVAGVRTAPGPSVSVPIDAVRSHVGVVEDDAEAIFHGALLLYLVVKESQRTGIEIDSEKVVHVTERFRLSHGLDTDTATEEWAHRNGLGEREFAALMEVLALVEHVATYHSVALDAFLPAELQRRGRFDAVRAAIAEKRAALEEYGLTFPSAEDLGTTTDDLLTWYETRFRPLLDLEDHVEARRFTDSARFVREVLSEYLVQTRRATMLAEHDG
jgi:hypothetical protein